MPNSRGYVHDTLEKLLRDFIATPLPVTVARDATPAMLERKADVFVGMRRSGKTYAMFDVMARLLGQGVPRDRIMYLNLEDDRLGLPTLATLDEALETFYRICPEARTEGGHVFLDEIQVVPEWERFCRRLLDTERVHLFLGGSSSRLLSKEVATTFRGRGFTVEVLPYGLREYARARGVDPSAPLTSVQRSQLMALADEYLERGGFPELVDASGLVRTQTLQSYVDMVVLKDVVERYGAENMVALRLLIAGLFAANASQFSVKSFTGVLRSQGLRTTPITVANYLEYLADAYLCFLVPIDSRSAKARAVNPRKVYAIDPGLAAAMHLGGASNRGAVLENAVYLELRRRLGPMGESAIAFHRTASGAEIDFVVDSPLAGRPREFVQVCVSFSGQQTVERETKAMAEALASAPGSTGTIVTHLESGELQTPAGVARVKPFWEWALEAGAACGAGLVGTAG